MNYRHSQPLSGFSAPVLLPLAWAQSRLKRFVREPLLPNWQPSTHVTTNVSRAARSSIIIFLIPSAHSFIPFHTTALSSIYSSSAFSQAVVSPPTPHSQGRGRESSFPYFLPTALTRGSVLLGICGRQCRTFLRVIQPRGE